MSRILTWVIRTGGYFTDYSKTADEDTGWSAEFVRVSTDCDSGRTIVDRWMNVEIQPRRGSDLRTIKVVSGRYDEDGLPMRLDHSRDMRSVESLPALVNTYSGGDWYDLGTRG